MYSSLEVLVVFFCHGLYPSILARYDILGYVSPAQGGHVYIYGEVFFLFAALRADYSQSKVW